VLCGCSKTTSINFPEKLDVPDAGEYTVFYIDDLSGTINQEITDEMIPTFLKSEPPHKMSTLIPVELQDFNQLYDAQFNINNTPYYIFLDSEENIFQTNDINKAKEFFKENIVH
jgi:hypothetical protein